jgi:hypothetical protein
VFCVKQCYETGNVVMVQREFRVRLDCREGPKTSTIERLVKTFEQTGSV